jgi:hypothetical protein
MFPSTDNEQEHHASRLQQKEDRETVHNFIAMKALGNVKVSLLQIAHLSITGLYSKDYGQYLQRCPKQRYNFS